MGQKAMKEGMTNQIGSKERLNCLVSQLVLDNQIKSLEEYNLKEKRLAEKAKLLTRNGSKIKDDLVKLKLQTQRLDYEVRAKAKKIINLYSELIFSAEDVTLKKVMEHFLVYNHTYDTPVETLSAFRQ